MTPTIIVAGEALVDLVPNADGSLSALLGGGPFNTVRAIGRLGQNAVFAGCVSTDRLGRSLAAALDSDGVRLDPRLRTDKPTSLALAEIDEAGAAAYGFYLTGTSALELTPEGALAVLPKAISALHVGSLGLLLEPMATASEALIRAVSGRAPVMLDPNVRPAVIQDMDGFRSRLLRLLAFTDILKVSDADLALLSPGVPVLDAAQAMLTYGPRIVLLTLGAAGAVVIHPLGAIPVAAPSITVVDTIGAGDIFSGAWLARWLEGGGSMNSLDLAAEATRYACLAASVSCSRAGAEPPTRTELAMIL